MTDVLTLPVAERDRLAAEKILRWQFVGIRENAPHKVLFEDDDLDLRQLRCSLIADDDYRILQKVREEWSRERQTAFVVALRRLLDSRARQAFGISITESLDTTWVLLYYEPGDYRDAALLVLAEKGEI